MWVKLCLVVLWGKYPVIEPQISDYSICQFTTVIKERACMQTKL